MTDKHSKADTKQAHDYLLNLGNLVVKFAKIERAPRYPSGDRENDAEHSYHLAISAVELAANYYPELDTGLVAQFSLVHDLPELYSGDVWTFQISDEDRIKKEAAEKQATKKLLRELPIKTAQLLKRYEEQIEPEARFVRLVDKLLPAIINIMAGDANTFIQDQGITTIEGLEAGHRVNAERWEKMYPEFQFIHKVRELISKTSVEQMFKKKP